MIQTGHTSSISGDFMRSSLCNYFSSDKTALSSQLQWCFNYFPRGGPGAYAEVGDERDREGSDIPFLLLPHGAFCDSGPLVADALLELDSRTGFFRGDGGGGSTTKVATESERCDASERTVLLIGTEHASMARSFLSLGRYTSWKTPLGAVEVDRRLFDRVSEILPVDDGPFRVEHSIENQLPFLQYLADVGNVTIRILPISVRASVTPHEFDKIILGQDGGNTQLRDLARILVEYNNEFVRGGDAGRRVAVIGTTDYSHVGPSYGFVPPGWPEAHTCSIPDYIRYLDGPILDGLRTNNVRQFWMASHRKTMCGRGATLVWLRLHELIGQTRVDDREKVGRRQRAVPRLLRYNVGSDIGPKHDDQTGFATFVIL